MTNLPLNSVTRQRRNPTNDTRIFSPLTVAGLCVTIGRYWYLFKRLTAVSAGRFYRFEHIVPYSSFKAHSKQTRYFEVRLLFLRQRKVYVLPRFRHKTSTAEKAMQDRPSPYRRPLRILISRKAGLYITLGGLDHHTP